MFEQATRCVSERRKLLGGGSVKTLVFSTLGLVTAASLLVPTSQAAETANQTTVTRMAVGNAALVVDPAQRTFTMTSEGPSYRLGKDVKTAPSDSGLYMWSQINGETGIMSVGEDATIWWDGQQITTDGKFTPGMTYSTPYVSDADGQIWYRNGTSLTRVQNAPKAPANINIRDNFVDGNSHIWRVGKDGKMQDVTASGQPTLTPNQWDVVMSAWSSSGVDAYVKEDGTLSLDSNVSGLTPGTYYGVANRPFYIVDGSSQLWVCKYSGNSCRKIELKSGTQGPIPELVAGSFYGDSNTDVDDYVYISDKNGSVWDIDASTGYVTLNKTNIQTTPGLMAASSMDSNGADDVYVIDNNGSFWRLHLHSGTTYPSQFGNTSGGQKSDCAYQLPQSGDPAAAWTQALPYVVAVLAVAGAAGTVMASRRQHV